jgi:pimeloyl-ACP methyl ester carboxylesterase
MTATPAWPAQGPRDRDELVSWTTAMLADDQLGDVPELRGPHPEGWTELVDGGGVHIRRDPGPAGAPPVWFIHGLGGSSTDFSRLSAALSPIATGYTLDLPGSGRSDPPPRGRHSPLTDADVAAATIERVSGGPVHLVGNSYGGVVATLLAAQHPELVRTLTLLSPAVPDLRLTRDRGADPRLGLLLMPGTAGLAYQRLGSILPMDRARGMGELCFGQPGIVTDADYQAAAAEHLWRGSLPWVFSATVGTLRGLMRWYLRPGRLSFASAARQVRAPTLIIWGTRDRLMDVRLSRRTAAAFAQASLLVLAGCGHVPQMEDPWSTARAMMTLWRRERSEGGSVGPHPAESLPPGSVKTGAPRRSDLSAVATS